MEALVNEMLAGKILLDEAVNEFERIFIERAFKQNEGRVAKTAEILGIHRNTLSAKLNSYKKVDDAAAKQIRRPVTTGSKKRSAPKKLKSRAAGGST
jgi:DNA-binding NtrC family response regulator